MYARYKYQINYMVTFRKGGRKKKSKTTHFTKEIKNWNLHDMSQLEKWLISMEGGGCDVAIIDLLPARKDGEGVEG